MQSWETNHTVLKNNSYCSVRLRYQMLKSQVQLTLAINCYVCSCKTRKNSEKTQTQQRHCLLACQSR